MITEKVYFKNSRGMKLAGILDRPDTIAEKLSAVIICHGFTLFKEFKPLHELAQSLASKGFVSLRFDFSDCIGESGGLCEDMTLSHQVNDVISAVNFVENLDYVDKNKIGIAGHSLGGLTAIVASATDRRIRSIVAIAAPAKAEWQNAFDESTIQKLLKDGVADFPTWKKGHIELHRSFIDDLKEYDGTVLVSNVKVPIRFIQGDKDTIVPTKNGEELFKSANFPKDLQLIAGADHLFLKEEYSKPMIELSLDWFSRTLTNHSGKSHIL